MSVLMYKYLSQHKKDIAVKFARFLNRVLLSPDIPYFANSVDPDQLASEEAN